MKTKRPPRHSGNLLVIGYGNELRSDDGVGPRIARAVAEWHLARVRVMVCHQLAPELVVPIAAAQRVVFVDAMKDSSEVQVRTMEPEQSGQMMTHVVNPQALLALAQLLYGRSPAAMWITVPATNFSFGQELSRASRTGMNTALERIRTLASNRLAWKTGAKTKRSSTFAKEDVAIRGRQRHVSQKCYA